MTLGFWAALLILLLVIGVAAQNLFALRTLAAQRTQVRNLLLASNSLFDALQDAEIGQRGFLLTTNEHYLEPYLPAQTSVDRSMREIERLSALPGVPPFDLHTLRPLISAKFAEMEATLQAYRKTGQAAALRIVNSGQGKRTMDRIRVLIAAQDDVAMQTLNVRVARADTSGLWAMRWLMLGGILSVGLLLIVFFRLQLEMRRRVQAALALRLAEASVEIEVRGRTAKLTQENASLRDREQYIRQIGDQLPGGLIYQVLVGRDGKHRLLHISAGVERINGVSQQEALADIGILYRQYVDDDRARCTAALAEAERTFSEFRIEVRMRRPDGEVRWCLLTAAPHRLPGGDLLWNGIELDITAQKQAELALQDSETRLRLATEGSNIGLWDWDLRSNAVYFSLIWKRQIGYEEHEISNRFDEWQSRVHPDDLEAALATVQAYVAAPRASYESIFRLRHKDGSYRWILSQGSFLHNGSAQPERMLGAHIDITERKQAEQLLRENESLLSEAQHIAHVGSWWWVLTNNQIRFSSEANRIFGLPAEQPKRAVEQAFNQTHPDDIAIARAWVERMIAGEQPGELECRIVQTDGEVRSLVVRAEVHRDAQGQPLEVIGTFQDITERKMAEEKDRAQLAELLRWQKVTVGREARVQQLKEEINRLLAAQGQAFRYPGAVLPVQSSAATPDAEEDSE